MSAPSIVVRVARVYVVGVILAALSIATLSAISLTAVFVARDDHDALALGHLLATELEDHADHPDSHDRVVRHELAEQIWFGREIEVWRGDDRIGGDEREGVLRAWGGDEGCSLARVHDAPHRVCSVRADTGDVVVVATELAPMLRAMEPTLLVLALVSALVALAFGGAGRRRVAQALSPLSRFEAHVAQTAVPRAAPTAPRPRGPGSWNAAEIDSLAATFDALLTRFDEAMWREHRFVSDAAHELRTPLTRLRAQLELAREEARDGRAIDERLAASVRATTQLATACEALLAMARDTTGPTEAVDLGDVAEACIERLDPSEQARVRLVRSDATTNGSEPLLSLALANLIDNAAKYSDGAVVVHVRDEGERVRLVVEDEGPGIPEAELGRVREPFVRGTSGDAVRGTGLGLALADHVALLHRGTLTLENRAPRGLRATLALPRWSPAGS